MLILQGFLSRFIQTDDQLDLAITGDSASTPFASLQPALANLRLATQLRGKVFHLTDAALLTDVVIQV